MTESPTPNESATDAGNEVFQRLFGEAALAATGTTPQARLAPDFFPIVRDYCFGTVWSRPGLDLRTRSLLTIALVAAQGREAELRVHLRASARLGVSRHEVVEAIIHAGVYAGIPAASSAIRIAAEVLGEEGAG